MIYYTVTLPISCSLSALWDKGVSKVSLPAAVANGPSDNPTDDEVIESACYTRLAEPYMVEKYKSDEEYWDRYDVQPSWTYFGAHNGLFRMIPATHIEQCGSYDPRKRPWFVAASSGPKDVVVVLDVSGSMEDYGRMDTAKKAAITVVETLTVADRVAVVVFSDEATLVGTSETKLLRATKENKDNLIRAIGRLTPNGSTNFYDAFDTAFDVLTNTIQKESTSGCNIAVLFMTDGGITVGPGADDVIRLVNEETAALSTSYSRDTTIFTYSLGIQADHTVTKKIACQTGGLWTPVDDYDDDLVDAMSSYYKLFALGLGEGSNKDYVAWVEPYDFANPPGKRGTTVSVPVYDRSVYPPLFLGAIGIDIYMDAIESVLGEGSSSSTMLDRFVALSTARCPKLELSDCELEALRYLGGGDEATCGVCNSTSYAGIVPQKCPFISDLPNNLWANTDMEGKSYEDRACCEPGGTTPSDVCPLQNPIGAGAIAGIVIGAVVVLCVLLVGIKKVVGKSKAKNELQRNPQGQGAVSYEGMSVITPPSAPPMNPNFTEEK